MGNGDNNTLPLLLFFFCFFSHLRALLNIQYQILCITTTNQQQHQPKRNYRTTRKTSKRHINVNVKSGITINKSTCATGVQLWCVWLVHSRDSLIDSWCVWRIRCGAPIHRIVWRKFFLIIVGFRANGLFIWWRICGPMNSVHKKTEKKIKREKKTKIKIMN